MLTGRGAWLNQFAVPSLENFASRTPDCDFLIIKCDDSLRAFAQRCGEIGKPWLAEIYPYQSRATDDALTLAEWSKMAGCVGAVVNFEDEDSEGNWDSDVDGTNTREFLMTYFANTGAPLYACLDTRGERANDRYQAECANVCAGVMPMVYPGAFEQSVEAAYAAAINQTMVDRWQGKPIMPVLQTYGDIGAASVALQVAHARRFPAHSAYTLAHATDDEWAAYIADPITIPEPSIPVPVDVDPGVEAMHALAVLMDNIIVPLAFGWSTQVQARLRYLYALANRPLPGRPEDS